MAEQENFHLAWLEKTQENDSKARISKEANMKGKIKFNKYQMWVTPWNI